METGGKQREDDAVLLKGGTSSDKSQHDDIRVIAEQASLFRTVLLEGSRSSTLANLFDFLLERANGGRSPKEIEIAMEVFGKSGTFDTSQDSMVRSHVHRLRQRLDRFNLGKSGPRLTIPKGEYRLILTEAPEANEQEGQPPLSPPSIVKRLGLKRVIVTALGANVLAWGLIFLFTHKPSLSSPLTRTALWNPVISSGRIPVIAVGDFYMIGQSDDDGLMQRLFLNPKIQSEAELSGYLMSHPEWRGKLHARDIYRVPGGVAKAALAVQNQMSSMYPGTATAVITPVSRMSQDRIDSNSIVYIQYFSQLGMLRSPILHLSSFAPTDNFDEIVDVASGTHYRVREAAGQRQGEKAEATSYGLDYGYLASFPGASGRHNILISGVGDAGLSQMVKILADKRQLDSLAKQTGKASAFEALYQVRTMGGLVFDTKLLIVRPLKADAMPGRTS